MQVDDDNRSELPPEDMARIENALSHTIAESTKVSYEAHMRSWVRWAEQKRYGVLPVSPESLVKFLVERATEGISPHTLQTTLYAVAYHHKQKGLESPLTEDVRGEMSNILREYGRVQKQAKGLTERRFAAIRATACQPRDMGFYRESNEKAMARGLVTIALIALMRDALLRLGEASDLCWSDLTSEPNGSGRLLLKRSKADQTGKGVLLFVSPRTMRDLATIRNGAKGDDSVFGLSYNQIRTRIPVAAKQAGLGDGFTGHSPRVGMAQDLARTGTRLPALMTAGRWTSATTLARYIRREEAGRSAIARYYESMRLGIRFRDVDL